METKTDKELETIAKDHVFYKADVRYIALVELEKRGKLNKELRLTQEMLKIGRNERKEKQRHWYNENIFKKDKNIVESENVPELYSQKTIYAFSLFANTLFGAILLGINLKKQEKKQAILYLFIFTILYTVLSVVILNKVSSFGIFSNILGGFILNELFWKRYIGKDFKYRKRKVIVPIIIGVSLYAIFILVLFFQN